MLDRISSDSLREATGRGWDEWLETLDAPGFEVGVRRSVDASEADVWELLTSRPELWLGEGVAFRKGERYSVAGASGAGLALG